MLQSATLACEVFAYAVPVCDVLCCAVLDLLCYDLACAVLQCVLLCYVMSSCALLRCARVCYSMRDAMLCFLLLCYARRNLSETQQIKLGNQRSKDPGETWARRKRPRNPRNIPRQDTGKTSSQHKYTVHPAWRSGS